MADKMLVTGWHVDISLITTVGLMVVSVLSLSCDDSVIGEAFREVLSMLDEVCIVNVIFLNVFLLAVCDYQV